MLTRADLQRREADMAQRKGKMSMLAGFIGAGSTVLSAGGKIAGNYAYPTGGSRTG